MWSVDEKVLEFERSSKVQGRPTSPDKVPKWPEARVGAKDPGGADPASAKKRKWLRADAGTSDNVAAPIRLFRGA
jgi:hypothetical protein